MNKAFDAAIRKGRNAFLEGRKRTECPYEDKRTPHHNHATFSRAFRTAWFKGYDEAASEVTK